MNNMDLEENNIEKDFKKLYELIDGKISDYGTKIYEINEEYSIDLCESYDSQKVNYERYMYEDDEKKIEDFRKIKDFSYIKPKEPDKHCLEIKYKEKIKILKFNPFCDYTKVGDSNFQNLKLGNYEGYDSRFWDPIVSILIIVLIIAFIIFLLTILVQGVSGLVKERQETLIGYGKFFAVIVPVRIFGYFWVQVNDYKVYKGTMIQANKNIEKWNKELKEKKEICNNELKKYEEALLIYEKEKKEYENDKKEAELLLQEYNKKLIEEAERKANERNAKIKKILEENYDFVQQYYKLGDELDLKCEEFNNKYNVRINSDILYDLDSFFDQVGGVSREAIILFDYLYDYANYNQNYNHALVEVEDAYTAEELRIAKVSLEDAKNDLNNARHDLEHYFDSIKQLKQFSRYTFKDILGLRIKTDEDLITI